MDQEHPMAMHKTPITVQDKFRNALHAIKPTGGDYIPAPKPPPNPPCVPGIVACFCAKPSCPS